MKFINLTPHDINIRDHKGTYRTFPRSGQVARLFEAVQFSKVIAVDDTVDEKNSPMTWGIEAFNSATGEPTGVPAPVPDTVYLVSLSVRQALPDRTDLASPGDLLRDEKGQPIGCNGLKFNP